MHHLMLDLETYGTKINAAIVSIGAIAFDPLTGLLDRERALHVRIDLSRSSQPGTIDANTVEWWMRQSDTARSELLAEGREDLQGALMRFGLWVASYAKTPQACADENLVLWSNPPNFDERILREAWDRHFEKVPFPVHRRGSGCLRTIKRVAKHADIPYEMVKQAGTVHNALEDAIHQAEVVSFIYQRLPTKNPPIETPV